MKRKIVLHSKDETASILQWKFWSKVTKQLCLQQIAGTLRLGAQGTLRNNTTINQTLSSYQETLTKQDYEENENLRHIREVILTAFLDELKYFLTGNAQTKMNKTEKNYVKYKATFEIRKLYL